MPTPPRTLVTVAAAMAFSLLGVPWATAQVPLPPGITMPPRPSDTTTTVAARPVPVPTIPSTSPATTAPPSSTSPGPAGAAGQTAILPVPAPAPAPAPTSPPPTSPAPTAPPAETKLIPVPQDTRAPQTGAPGPAPSTTKAGDLPAAAPSSAASLSPGQVDMVLRDQQRSGASSTNALVEALRPLQNFGMTAQEALALGMGQFPLLGVANWTDDWLDPRAGPPPHQHQGTDVFAAFDIPVRAPVDGVVRFEDAGLGGKGAFVTAPDGTYYYMAHLNGFSRDLGSGATVKQGQVIGFNGDSGNAKGGAPHVHFEIHPMGGGAVNPKPFLDSWVASALARVPELIASFQPKAVEGGSPDTVEGGVPQILVTTGQTRRFSAPSLPAPGRERPTGDFKSAVLGPLTPSALAPLLEQR